MSPIQPSSCSLSIRAPPRAARSCSIARGKAVASAQQEFPQIFPGPGHVEHDPEAIWSTQLQTAKDAIAKAGATAHDLAAIGVTNQRETTVLWDKATGKPIANAIVWQSRVTAPICDRLKAAGHEPLFRKKTGLVVDAYFSGTKIKHLLDSFDGVRARAARGEVLFGTIDSFLIWRLTGGKVHVTDVSNASRTLLFNIHTLEWDDELLRLLDVPARDDAGSASLPAKCTAHTDPKLFGARGPDRGCRGRSAGGALRPGVLRAGLGEEHLRHGLFHVAQYRRETGAVGKGAAHHRGVDGRRGDDLCARRFGVRRRRRGAMAARRDEGDQVVSGCRAADGGGARHRRRLPRAGVRGARRAVLGSARPRHHRRPHAQHADGPRCPRGRGCDGVSNRGRARSDAVRIAAAAEDAEGGWRRRGQRDAAAVPGRSLERHRSPARGGRDHRVRRGVSCRSCGRLLEGLRRRDEELGARSRIPAGDGRGEARPLYAGWKKAVDRSLEWES